MEYSFWKISNYCGTLSHKRSMIQLLKSRIHLIKKLYPIIKQSLRKYLPLKIIIACKQDPIYNIYELMQWNGTYLYLFKNRNS